MHHNNNLRYHYAPCRTNPPTPEKSAAPSPGTYFSRVEALQLRVNEAARALHERGVRPTVARIRAALGGGSPNDLAPALKHWKESVLPGLPARAGHPGDAHFPGCNTAVIADLGVRVVATRDRRGRGGTQRRPDRPTGHRANRGSPGSTLPGRRATRPAPA